MVGLCFEFYSIKCEWVLRMLCWFYFYYVFLGIFNFGMLVFLMNMLLVFYSIDVLMICLSMGCVSFWFLKLKWICIMYVNNCDNKVVLMWVFVVLYIGI